MINFNIFAHKYFVTAVNNKPHANSFFARKGQNEPKSVNVDKISTLVHVHYINLTVNETNTVQIAQIRLRMHYCTPSDAIKGPKNRVFEIKSTGHDSVCRYRNSI